MDGTGFVIGCALISMGIYYGLEKIADAVRYKRTDINFKDAIKIVHGTREDFEKAVEPIAPQSEQERRN